MRNGIFLPLLIASFFILLLAGVRTLLDGVLNMGVDLVESFGVEIVRD